MTEEKKIGARLIDIANNDFDGNQAEMARTMGMTAQGMNPYFNGDRKPGFKILKRLVELGYNSTHIIAGIGPAKISDMLSSDVLTFVNSDAEEYKSRGVEEVAKGTPKHLKLSKLTPEVYNNPIKMMSYMIEDFMTAWENEGQYLPPAQQKEVLLKMIDIISQQATNARNRLEMK